MDTNDILGAVHMHAKAEESYLVIATVRAYIEGTGSVRIEVTDKGTVGPYQYNATVYDGETGEFLATGNGGRDINEALSLVHWQNARNRGV